MKVKPAFKVRVLNYKLFKCILYLFFIQLPEKQKSETGTVGRRSRSIVPLATLPSVAALTIEQEAEDLKKLGVRLRNLLKLPKAHKWVCYEWFYSNLDQ